MALFSPNSIFKKKNPVNENYLSLTITPEKVLALIWAFRQSSIQVLGYAEAKFKDPENLVHQAAVAIDQASEEAKSDVSQVVFGLSRNWFDDGQVSSETSRLLESMSSDLELKAQAFVPLSVSIKNYLKSQEGAAPNVICVGLFENLCEAHLIKNNQVTASTQTRTNQTPEKVVELIKSLDAKEALPSRIVIFGEHDSHIMGKLQDSNLSDLFTQEPRIEYLSERELAESVAFAQGADILGHEVATQVSAQPVNKVPKEVKEPDEFGFVEGEDILKDKTQENVVGQREASLSALPQPKLPHVPPEQTKEKPAEVENKQPKTPGVSILDQILTLAWFEKITGIFKKQDSPRKIAVALIVLIAIFLMSSLILGQTISRAQVTIRVKSQPQEENFSAQVIVGSESNFDSKQVAGETISARTQGSQKGVPTGKKKLGNNSKGQVTVFNWTTSQTTFPAKTTIISPQGIKFNLDSGIQIASRSASQPGQEQVAVTAADFGPEANLASGTDFNFQQYDSLLYSARNDNAFSGGDEKEITVVSTGDMDKLDKSLSSELKEKSIENLKSSNPDKVIGDDAITIDVTKKQFDKKVDEEATLFNLDMNVTASVITYEQSKLNELLSAIANEDAPQELEAKPQNIEVLSLNSKASGGKLNLVGKFRANFIPKLDENDLKSTIAGKGEKQVRDILMQNPQITDVSIDFSPGFLLAPKIPKTEEKVTIKIETTT
ncbi:hypothetical protein A3A60_01855 [Candidatus Curtissbacteria bacterium RIFCSPLOWO2_01_FULL_42_26]|uniref:Baseplate protein J-like domain-containing protein n=1 Tax=Candidatus Curtissbacteria bacterium RIFCSPLOWO2_01_FULL_42_26 TaxID=1797729 RepID=A0A1F5I1H0_9BACT|nr:MAG: hypothetical protein A3A60_01855 [Candidatus Curtissbacteria bacterium RIFCSPLOWO2_01_FULL_42_26]